LINYNGSPRKPEQWEHTKEEAKREREKRKTLQAEIQKDQ